MIIAYDGTKYFGWQRQNKQTDKTIQGKLENILTKMTGFNVEVTGSGRTDAGVHAIAQVAHFYAHTDMSPLEIQRYLNLYLPEDIAVKSVEEVGERFHARYLVKRKTYLYRIHTDEIHPVFERKYVYNLGQALDLDKMYEASRVLIGEHDFVALSTKSTKKSTVKRIDAIDFEQKEGELQIKITGSGFLYNMVRIIVGTLIEIGLEQRPVSDMKMILEKKDRTLAGPTAPAQGLCLYSVEYKDEI